MSVDSMRFQDLAHKVRCDVPGLIGLRREGAYWDFKKQWHENNWELLHDITCLANNLESETSFLIIGIDENNDYIACDVAEDSKRKTNQSLIDMLNKHSWGGRQPPFIIVVPLDYEGATIDVVVIVSRRDDMPYYLIKPDGSLKPWMIHTRRSDQNTPIDAGANWGEIVQIWRHHFGLDASPLEQARTMLQDKDGWVYMTSIANSEDKYYRFAPEYTICHSLDDERNAYEYYMLNQVNCSSYWYEISLRYHQATLFDTLGVSLDGGRYFTPIPLRSFIRWPGVRDRIEADLSYCYFTLDSLDWALNEFFFDEDNCEARIARERFLKLVVLFKNEEERSDFEWFLRERKDEFEKRYSTQQTPYGQEQLPGTYSQCARELLGGQMKSVLIIKEMLKEYYNYV